MPNMERITVPIEWKADDEPGTLTGYASTFGNVDLGGDAVVPGAFDKFVQWINASKDNTIPLLADHIAMTSHVLGSIHTAKTDQNGLVIKARLSKAPSVQDIATKMQEGHVNRLSIGYEAMDYAFEDKDGMRVRLLKDIKLWETSAVVFPMNPEAVIQGVKHALAAGAEAGFKADDLRKAAEADGLIVGEVKSDDGLMPQVDTLAVWKHTLAIESKTGVQSGQPSHGDEANGSHGEDQRGSATASGEESGGQSGETDSKGGWDPYTSAALLEGRPTEPVDPAERAGLEESLRLAEAAIDPGADN